MRFLKKMLFLSGIFLTQALFSQTEESANHYTAEHGPNFFDYLLTPKFIVMLVLGLIVLLLLKTQKMKKGIKVVLLLISTFLFGIAGNIPTEFFSNFAMHPSPMCAATRPLLYGFGMPFVVTLFVIFLLTLVGPKLFCGYICPVGAVQELMAMLADKLNIVRKKFSFTLSHGIRLGIFIAFIFISVTGILYLVYEGERYSQSLYDYLNAFHGLEFGMRETFMDNVVNYFPFVLTLMLSLKLYRPFCHFVCPIGLFTHFLEQVSLFRISLNKKSCTDCTICTDESPCVAIPEILKESTLRPDCYSCNVCVESCPSKAFTVGIKRSK
jgi:polyferredoxin